ncbi:hypothetical protein Ddye_017192 [Dipteronia dyeriana]|uniref:SWIM-type domain-containing protein n=1 Tax=Dipteronia dyeriana TaxID=168575 RepID=A0AAD9U8V1_9ROSI|nr:hypothetical protein Ddye_017192 [Dipteronia dyeriana]
MRPNFKLYDGVSDFKEVKLEVGQDFTSSKVFKEAIKEYAIRCGRVIWFPCNKKGRVKGIYKGKNTNCPWSIWATKYEKNSDAFMIKTLNDKHTCPRINKSRHANSTWLFKRKIIGLDACLVKAYHKSQLMWAIGIDTNNGYYLIARVIVEKEWHESWSWFSKLLKEDLNFTDCLGITFMIDGQKSLIESIGNIWPNCEHRFYVRHMYTNFKKKFKDDIIRGKILKAHRGGDGHQPNTYCYGEPERKNCTCRKWNLTGIPCEHAITAIFSEYEDSSMYVDICYHKETQMKCFGDVMYGIKMEKYWTKIGRPPLVPPKIVKQPGRPKKLRIREIGEISPSQRKFKQVHKSYTCSACKQKGHNYKRCSKRVKLVARISKKSIRSHSPQTEGSNALETDNEEEDVEDTNNALEIDHGEDDVGVANQDFFSEMIHQTTVENNIDLSCTLDTETWKKNLMTTLHSAMENYKQMVQNLQYETSVAEVTKNKKKKTK